MIDGAAPPSLVGCSVNNVVGLAAGEATTGDDVGALVLSPLVGTKVTETDGTVVKGFVVGETADGACGPSREGLVVAASLGVGWVVSPTKLLGSWVFTGETVVDGLTNTVGRGCIEGLFKTFGACDKPVGVTAGANPPAGAGAFETFIDGVAPPPLVGPFVDALAGLSDGEVTIVDVGMLVDGKSVEAVVGDKKEGTIVADPIKVGTLLGSAEFEIDGGRVIVGRGEAGGLGFNDGLSITLGASNVGARVGAPAFAGAFEIEVEGGPSPALVGGSVVNAGAGLVDGKIADEDGPLVFPPLVGTKVVDNDGLAVTGVASDASADGANVGDFVRLEEKLGDNVFDATGRPDLVGRGEVEG